MELSFTSPDLDTVDLQMQSNPLWKSIALRLGQPLTIYLLVALLLTLFVAKVVRQARPSHDQSVTDPKNSPVLTNEEMLRNEQLENGDLIFRRGTSLESRTIMAFDKGFEFSHVGIVRKTGPDIEVIHASFGEEGQTEEIIISEPIDRFLKPSSSAAAAAYRLNDQDTSKPLIALSEADRFLKARIPFDRDYDLRTAEKIYCTELIWRAYKKAGVDLTAGKFDRVPYLFDDPNKYYILLSSLFKSAQLRKVWATGR
jgi:Permuted papain-like amidase enzyme, YaeF/YiiX, C92 family